MRWRFRTVLHSLLPIAATSSSQVLLHGLRQWWRQWWPSHVYCWQPHEAVAARWGYGVDAEHMHVIIGTTSSSTSSLCSWMRRCRLLSTLAPRLLLLTVLLLLLLVCAWLV
jgi:hypothetical protein